MDTLIDKTILDEVYSHLTARDETIAVSESVTAGLLQASLASAKGATGFFHGGITTYNIGQKARHLGINAIHAAQCNSVSAQIAEQMALQVSILFVSDWGIGVTGYATPVPESRNKLYCHYAICFRGKLLASKEMTSVHTEPFNVQIAYINGILKQLIYCLKRREKISAKKKPQLKNESKAKKPRKDGAA